VIRLADTSGRRRGLVGAVRSGTMARRGEAAEDRVKPARQHRTPTDSCLMTTGRLFDLHGRLVKEVTLTATPEVYVDPDVELCPCCVGTKHASDVGGVGYLRGTQGADGVVQYHHCGPIYRPTRRPQDR
jgi:hypothetical protein